ncbi:hypothetical protein [Mesorhizobium sp.]|uniref:hypothetical protein n=1 Tax=Mesorhizobium sp. TaxID=1871066 RepID=UPI0025FC7AEA|nr:hypothetical protein [Mesorhizobium sp.]
MKKIAEGVALMTETAVEAQITDANSDVLHNKVLQEVTYENMKRVGDPGFDETDYAFAEQLQKNVLTKEIVSSVASYDRSLATQVLHDGLLPMPTHEEVMMGSTDVGDVSWIVPTVQCNTACFATGSRSTPGSSSRKGICPQPIRGWCSRRRPWPPRRPIACAIRYHRPRATLHLPDPAGGHARRPASLGRLIPLFLRARIPGLPRQPP